MSLITPLPQMGPLQTNLLGPVQFPYHPCILSQCLFQLENNIFESTAQDVLWSLALTAVYVCKQNMCQILVAFFQTTRILLPHGSRWKFQIKTLSPSRNFYYLPWETCGNFLDPYICNEIFPLDLISVNVYLIFIVFSGKEKDEPHP